MYTTRRLLLAEQSIAAKIGQQCCVGARNCPRFSPNPRPSGGWNVGSQNPLTPEKNSRNRRFKGARTGDLMRESGTTRFSIRNQFMVRRETVIKESLPEDQRIAQDRSRDTSMAIAIALILVAVGSVLFHIFSPWWWTPIASNWGFMDSMITLTFWITGIVFVAIILFMAYCVIKFRHKEGRVAAYEPENNKLEIWLTIITTIGVTALLVPGLVVWAQFVTVPDDATEIEVVAQQWYWSYRLPGEDGKLGTVDNRLITFDNPLGINPDDPFGLDDVVIESDDLHLPIGLPVNVLLRSVDVVHDFYVPEFRAKMDMVPGMITSFWFTPTRTGEFEVLCAELCGVGHAFMRGALWVDSAEDYVAWLQDQSTFSQLMAENAAPTDTAQSDVDVAQLTKP